MKINNSNINFKAYKMTQKQAQQINNTIKKSSKIDIICHESTDRDSANSALAMADYIEQQGINARIILSQDLKSLTLRAQDKNIIQAKNLKDDETPDTVLCVDFCKKERVAPNVCNYIKKANNIIGLDHHLGVDITQDSLTLTKEKNSTNKTASFYIDTTAKSATSVIYRFFEAIDREISDDTAYDLFFGLISDCNKKGLVKCDGKNGTINATKEMMQDKNAYEIYQNLLKKLTPEKVSSIARKIDIISSLSQQEKAFGDSLYEKIKYNKKGTIAYVEIPPNDKTWNELEGDNSTTSAILNHFRQTVLKKYNNIKTVFAFYQANNTYRLSVHSKEKNLKQLYDTALDKITNNGFTIGGHEDRGGGKINSTDEKTCHEWVKSIIAIADLYN